jgi:flagellar motor switch protein FliG
MAEETQAVEGNPLANLNKTQRLAAFLTVVGSDVASGILKELDEADVEAVTAEMAKLGFVSVPMQRALLEEFSGMAVDAVASLHGGPEIARSLLEKSYGSYRANEVISRIAPTRPRSIDTTVLREIQPRQLANILRREMPQTWALVLSYLEPNKCAEVLTLVQPDLRADIVERIANIEPVTSEIAQQVFTFLRHRAAQRAPQDVATSGGTQLLADILNNLDDALSQQILSALEERNPDLSRSIKKLLFTFDDLAELDKNSISRVLREVDFHLLAVALKTASDKLKQIIFSTLSKRASETIKEEIQYMPPVKLSEVEKAQDSILEVVRNLAANGEITLPGRDGGGETV